MPSKNQEKKRKAKRNFNPKNMENPSADEKLRVEIVAPESKSVANIVIVKQMQANSAHLGIESSPKYDQKDQGVESKEMKSKSKIITIAGAAIPAIGLSIEKSSQSSERTISLQDYHQLKKQFEDYQKKTDEQIKDFVLATTTKELDIIKLKKKKDHLEQNLIKFKENEKEYNRKFDEKILECEAKISKIQKAYKTLHEEKFEALEEKTKARHENRVLNDKLASIRNALKLREEQITEFKNQLTKENAKLGDHDQLKNENDVLKETVMSLNKETKASELNRNSLQEENIALEEKLLISKKEDQNKFNLISQLNEQSQIDNQHFKQELNDIRKLVEEKESIIQNSDKEKENIKEMAYKTVAKAFVEGNVKLVVQKLELDRKREIELKDLKDKQLQEINQIKSDNAEQIIKMKKGINDINDLEKELVVSYHETRFNQLEELNQGKIDRITSFSNRRNLK